MRITNLSTSIEGAREQAAALLVAGFAERWPDAWPDLDGALRTVDEAMSCGRICRVALNDAGVVLGWTAAEPLYNGNVWELNVIVVQPARQRQGIGRALIEDNGFRHCRRPARRQRPGQTGHFPGQIRCTTVSGPDFVVKLTERTTRAIQHSAN